MPKYRTDMQTQQLEKWEDRTIQKLLEKGINEPLARALIMRKYIREFGDRGMMFAACLKDALEFGERLEELSNLGWHIPEKSAQLLLEGILELYHEFEKHDALARASTVNYKEKVKQITEARIEEDPGAKN